MSTFLLTFIIALPATATQLFVSFDGIGTTCTQGNPWTLQTALAQASDNDAIYLAQGTYTGTGAAWVLQQKLIATDGAGGDHFGRVALSGDGTTALVGASGADVEGRTDQGAAYVFMD